jgi:SAM-dependent methyltransferase
MKGKNTINPPAPAGSAGGTAAAVFALAILIGAFLLFQVQPLVSKAILPWFGGSPSVWTTCMLFFQVLLLLGYLYAHLLRRWLAPRNQAAVHLALVALALMALPACPTDAWKPAETLQPVRQILLILSGTVGLPFFVLSATSPLAQSWFSGVYPGRSPYRLYALSNAGSLAALLSYPFVLEPALDLSRQSAFWSGGMVLYAILCAAMLACVWPLKTKLHEAEETEEAAAARPTTWDRLRWLVLPALASVMLLATTNHICQDVAVVPFLWVAPLSLYLLSFIVCFDHSRWYVRPFWAAGALVLLVGAAANDFYRLGESAYALTLMQELCLYLGAMFFACMVCHGELARLKPSPRHLTEYYLWIAVGGALGGVLVALVAPLMFSMYLEWQIAVSTIGVLAFALLMPPALWTIRVAKDLKHPKHSSKARHFTFWRVIGYVLVIFVAAIGALHIAVWGGGFGRPIARARNFFGVVSVVGHYDEAKDINELQIQHGRIRHGRQSMDQEKSRWATGYYGPTSGAGKAVAFQQLAGPIRLGVVGLGVGTMAAYIRPEDEIVFYEINPAVIFLSGRYFTYLSDCPGKKDIILGDARLSLEAEPPREYDVLVLDAFSGDAIPTHLLTREAFEVYLRHLQPDGIIAVHVSNGYLRLAPVVRRLAEHFGMKAVRISNVGDDARLIDGSEWVLVTRNKEFLDLHAENIMTAADGDAPLWTDQYSNLFQALAPR